MPFFYREWVFTVFLSGDGDMTKPLSMKTIVSGGYRNQWKKRFGRVLVNFPGFQRISVYFILGILRTDLWSQGIGQ